MGNFRPLPTKCWEKYLASLGYECVRTKGSHDQWVRKNSRTIPVWGNEKEIPAFQLKCSCKTIGKTIQELYQWADQNC